MWCSPAARRVVLIYTVVFLSGCGGKPYKVVEVDGAVIVNGKPGHKMHVEFIPDVDQGTIGPVSVADTDAQGRFTLTLQEPGGASSPGAVVGSHRVVLIDLQMAESATGRGVPIRLKPDHSVASSTPLRQQVKDQSGKQTVEIKLP
jgi:hypothetical protein